MTITVLTLNLMTDMPGHTRQERLFKIADFINYYNPVDVILLQEACGGLIAGTFNTMQFLKKNLIDHFEIVSASLSQPWLQPFFNVKTGIMSRLPILATNKIYLNSQPGNSWIEKVLWSRRPIVKATLKVVGTTIDVYSVHLSTTDQVNDVDKLLGIINPFTNVIVGGDFNISRQSDLFNKFKVDFAEAETKAQPDFIFYNPKAFEVLKKEVVFDGLNGPIISDHSGVLVKFSKK